MAVHDFDVPQLLVRDLSCVAGVRQREVAFVVRVYGRQEGAGSSFQTVSLTGLSSLLRDPAHSTEPALTPPQRWPLIPLQRWPRLSHLPGLPSSEPIYFQGCCCVGDQAFLKSPMNFTGSKALVNHIYKALVNCT